MNQCIFCDTKDLPCFCDGWQDFENLIKYCNSIDEKQWANNLKTIKTGDKIEDFCDLECHLSDHNMDGYRGALIRKVEAVQK